MKLYYNFSRTKTISTFVSSDCFEGSVPPSFCLDVEEIEDGYYNGKVRKIPVLKDQQGAYFIYRKKKIHIQDFIWNTVDELIQEMKKQNAVDHFPSLEEQLIATCIKDTKNVAISEKTEKGEIFYAPFETPLYQKKDWGYKIPFKEIDTSTHEFKKDANSRVFYSCDLAHLFEIGIFRLMKRSDIQD